MGILIEEKVLVWGEGSAQVTSLGGVMYFVIYVNATSRKVWVYFLKKKSTNSLRFPKSGKPLWRKHIVRLDVFGPRLMTNTV